MKNKFSERKKIVKYIFGDFFLLTENSSLVKNFFAHSSHYCHYCHYCHNYHCKVSTRLLELRRAATNICIVFSCPEAALEV